MASLSLPQAASTVRLRAIDAKTLMSLHTRRFMEPEINGFETINLTSVCFLIENAELNKRILFDCGARKDFENYSPTTPDVLVCIAHDPTLLKVLPMLNEQPEQDLNDWQAKGYKTKLLWGWLNELPRHGKAGRPMLIDGAWRDGERVADFLKLPSSR